MSNSLHSSSVAVSKAHIKLIQKKMSKIFSDGMGTRINWSFHAAERLIERFGGQPTQIMVTLLKYAMHLHQSVEAVGYRKVAVDRNGVRLVVASGENGYSVVTVIEDSMKFHGGYDFRND